MRGARQEELRPILLRRMKEDVENLPEKEEVVVRVQLTKQQRRFYNGIYEKQARLSVCAASAWLISPPDVRQLGRGLRLCKLSAACSALLQEHVQLL